MYRQVRQRESEELMAESTRNVRYRVVRLAIIVLVSLMVLLWSTAAYAQSREDQYGSPTDAVEPAGRVSDTLSVLPDTGGPLILLVGAALVVAGTGLAVVRRRDGRR